MQAEVLGPGQGRRYSARGSEMIFKALAASSGGDLSLMERTLPPGGRLPPPHRHTNCSEAYFGLDGLVTVTVEGAELTLGREDFVLVPRGTGHTFGNRSGERPGSWSSTPRRWTPTSPRCTTCGTGRSRRSPRRSGS